MRLLPLFLALSLCACGRADKAAAPLQSLHSEVSATAPRERQASAQPAAEPQRYRAVRQYLSIEVPRANLETAWRAANDDCIAAGNDCEILLSSISQGEFDAAAIASLQIRIAPQKHSGFRAKVVAAGELRDDRVESQDKTAEVIDTEARLKNTLALRDRFRGMLATPGSKLKDLIELEKELARVQSELDSLAGQRKALANETEKTFMQIDFRAKRSISEAGAFHPVSHAISTSVRIFAESVGSLITFVVAALPWAGLFVVMFFAVRRFLRHLRKNRSNSPS